MAFTDPTADDLIARFTDFRDVETKVIETAIADVKKKVGHCRVCQNLSDLEICRICADPKRDAATVPSISSF